MSPLLFLIAAFISSIGAGLLGAILGLGGGIIVIPVLTMLLGVDIRFAIGASLVSVIATSSGAAAAYVRERMTNLRVAMLLEIGTTSGALTGAFIATHMRSRWLFIVFGIIMAYSALMMYRRRSHELVTEVKPDRIADFLRLHDSYYDESIGETIHYRVTRPTLGLGLMYIAGVVSGMLGIGSGSLKVPAMDLGMRLPIKVSTATSNFMIGVTAAASAGVYMMRGEIRPFIAAPVAGGVMIGAIVGSRVLGKLKSHRIRLLFAVVLTWVSLSMLWKGVYGQ
ncbi:MAG: sulfite exporter TauE/SafE family protein [Tepidisphaeraceae bacterium]